MLSPLARSHIKPLPSPEALATARERLIDELPAAGLGAERVKQHLTQDITPALSLSSQSSTYYGFVTGGATEAAKHADHVAIDYDQNVQVHLPKETVATDVEDCALRMLCELIRLDPQSFKHRTVTTGATASNVMGLAMGAAAVISTKQHNPDPALVSELGLHNAMKAAEIDNIQVLTTVAHSSLRKAASIVGLGRAAIIDVGRTDETHRFDFNKLESLLKKPRVASIVAVSYAEVNTGFFATTGAEMQRLRELADQHGAWLHIDGAFGLLARALPQDDEYRLLADGAAGLELADSITGDAHKLVNVPYDCGFFLSRTIEHATEVFQNPNAAYLSSSAAAGIPSPLNIGIENSRRFRALPVYATLTAYGFEGYSDMIRRQVVLARAIAGYILDSPGYELLPDIRVEREDRLRLIYIVVLFRAKDEELNAQLVQRINDTRSIYISGTAWQGKPAARFAVANWQADVAQDLPVVKEVLAALL